MNVLSWWLLFFQIYIEVTSVTSVLAMGFSVSDAHTLVQTVGHFEGTKSPKLFAIF